MAFVVIAEIFVADGARGNETIRAGLFVKLRETGAGDAGNTAIKTRADPIGEKMRNEPVASLALSEHGATLDELSEVAAQISVTERRAMKAERETADRLIAHHLADRVGASFQGRISGVTRAGLFVKLDDTGADGLVPIRTLGTE